MKASHAMLLAERDRFLGAIAPECGFHALFDHLPGITFFAKDRQSRLMTANRLFFERFGFRDESEMVGKTDFDIAPPGMAEHFQRDDAEVMRSGRPRLNIIELFTTRAGTFDWFVTNKLPVRDRKGRVIGVMGTSQPYELARQASAPYKAVDQAVAVIRERYREKLTVEQLAARVNISPRQLHRRFVEAFGDSPQSFLLKVRLQAACDLLQRTGQSMSEIAAATGFSDQSAFAQHFRRQLGTTPLDYQKRHRLVQLKI